MNILEQIIQHKIKEVEKKKTDLPLSVMKTSTHYQRSGLSLKKKLNQHPGIIAEFKRKSPSKGIIRHAASVQDIVRSYERHGASACSILTDKVFFDGDTSDITAVRSLLHIPILRKDFIVDSYQIDEAKSIGSDLILLIAECLTPAQITDFTHHAHDLGMEVLMELHDLEELNKWNPDIDLLGINNRDLRNFHTGIEKSLDLVIHLPVESLWISESGLKGPDELRQLAAAGYRGFLIGETFMRANDPGKLCGEFVTSLSEIPT
ncbi:MAG: indole-3-glycerol phosphate synthase TrpC [Saprospiraceae bacterium]|nr:indole-3-glycerol phosphate synthase TrpC [Saprospiraceae bacterium]